MACTCRAIEAWAFLVKPSGSACGLAVPFLHRDALGQVAQRVVGGGLVGDDVDRELAGVVAAQDLREDLGGVADVAHGPAAALFLGLQDLGDGGVEVGLHLVEVALAGAAAQAWLSSTSTIRQAPSFRVTASGWAPPMPPQPPVRVRVPASVPSSSAA